jgi:3-oxoadipate enol-lactonase/4-carboxymuconolactone decarboxylase
VVDGGGVDLVVAEAGQDGPRLLAVHGFTGAKEDFTPFFDRWVASGWQVAAFDLRGHGESGKLDDPSDYSIERMAADVLDVLDALGWSSATLLGHSLGGVVVQEVALTFGERVDGLVLMDTSHGVFPGLTEELAELGVAVVRDGGVEAFLAATRDTGVAPNEADRLLRERDPGYAEWCDRKTLACAPAMFLGMIPALARRRDRLRDLATLRCPTQVLVGELDTVVDDSRRMAAAIKGARLDIVPGGGHCPQFEAPEAWWAALHAFLASLPAPTA